MKRLSLKRNFFKGSKLFMRYDELIFTAFFSTSTEEHSFREVTVTDKDHETTLSE